MTLQERYVKRGHDKLCDALKGVPESQRAKVLDAFHAVMDELEEPLLCRDFLQALVGSCEKRAMHVPMNWKRREVHALEDAARTLEAGAARYKEWEEDPVQVMGRILRALKKGVT